MMISTLELIGFCNGFPFFPGVPFLEAKLEVSAVPPGFPLLSAKGFHDLGEFGPS